MTLRQTIQAAPGKTTELITKLSATSNQAVKTRENLFAELSDELARYIEIEERQTSAVAPEAPREQRSRCGCLEREQGSARLFGEAFRRAEGQ